MDCLLSTLLIMMDGAFLQMSSSPALNNVGQTTTNTSATTTGGVMAVLGVTQSETWIDPAMLPPE